MSSFWNKVDHTLSIRVEDGADHILRCRSIAAIALLLSMAAGSISIAGLFFAEPSLKRIIGPAFILSNMVAIWILRQTHSPRWPAIITVAGLVLAVSTYILGTGGLAGFATPIIIAVPLSMWLLFGMREAQIASCGCVAFIWLLFVLSPEAASNLLGAAFIYTFVLGALTLIAMVFTAVNHQLRAEVTQARDEALHSAHAKAEFLANMSHEIRTPLNGVMGMAQLLQTSTLPPKEREYADIIHSSSYSLLTIVSDILDFSKIEAGKLSLEPHTCSLRDLSDDVVNLLRPAAEKKGLKLLTHLPASAPDRVIADAGRLRQILLNITGNAIKFTEAGRVVIRVEVEPVGSQANITFQVVDTGIGIPEEHQSTIFEEFSQGDSSTTRRFGGTGLGLSISRSLAEAMGGAIHLQSKPGIGSAFTIRLELPLAEELRATG